MTGREGYMGMGTYRIALDTFRLLMMLLEYLLEDILLDLDAIWDKNPPYSKHLQPPTV